MVLIEPSLPSPEDLSLPPLLFYGKNSPPINDATQKGTIVVNFVNSRINRSAFEAIPILGDHIQRFKLDTVRIYLHL